jgi:hypothetical protein
LDSLPPHCPPVLFLTSTQAESLSAAEWGSHFAEQSIVVLPAAAPTGSTHSSWKSKDGTLDLSSFIQLDTELEVHGVSYIFLSNQLKLMFYYS